MTRVKVAVRVRPLSNREVEAGTSSIIAVENGRTMAITNTKVPEQNAGDSRERVRRFTFDYCFQEDATQDHIFEEVEKVVGQSLKRRCHSCVLAYGQSSSGKTHTMMGFPHDPGLTPKLCHRVFGYLQETAVGDEVLDLKVSVSYLEIYNEKVKDLLRNEDSEYDENSKKTHRLRVREHPKKGPYVQGLSEHPVADSQGLLDWLEIGNKRRRVAATLTNPRSSRSHAVFSVSCDGVKLHLIDLAGSERAGSKCYGTSQFREGANINKSLVALGNVISALAEQTAKQAKGLRRKFVPYRDSVLTWLLKDTLGGNSNTLMVATVSPSSACYSETVNTLRFGQRAKLIVSHPVVNEDPKEKTIRELRAEIVKLKELLKLSQFSPQAFPMLENETCSLENQEGQKTDVFNVINEDINSEQEEVDKNPVSEQLSTSVSNRSSSSEDITLIDSETPSIYNLVSETSTETLLPLLRVSTTLKPSKTRPTKLRRTFSVDHTYLNKQKHKMFGSEESIQSTSIPSKALELSSSSLEKRKSQDSLSKKAPGNVPASSSLRRRSLNKSNQSLPKTPPKRGSLENNLQKNEKATITESLKKVEPRVNSIRKQPVKPRSQIVAAVTSRLYAKINIKDSATSTDDLNVQRNQTPKEVTTSSTARLRLREITRKALKAYKQRHEQTQTETVLPVLRVKEISTDVNDLKIDLDEVKNAETEPIFRETKDASVSCTLLQQLPDNDKIRNISFTRSCGTQSSEELNSVDAGENSNVKAGNPISFTKYLQSPKYEVSDVMPNTPIYTKTVNINISHNYINGSTGNASISDDSIEQNTQNVGLPTPDLISNHNSLEQGYEDFESPQKMRSTNAGKINFADVAELDEYLTVKEVVPPPILNKSCTVASYTVAPRCREKVQCVNKENVQAPEICLINKFEEGLCKPLPKFEPSFAKPKIVETNYYKCDDCIRLQEPLVLKSIVKQMPKDDRSNDANSSSSDEETVSSDLPDSLDYHMANIKKVKFNKRNSKTAPENHRMLNAMSDFLEEATNLMNNLTMAASKLGSNNLHLDDSYEFEVTVNDARRPAKPNRKRRRPFSVPRMKQNSAPYFHVSRTDCSTQCDYSVPVNKYEALVEESCKRLEEKINKMPTCQQNVHLGNNFCDFNSEEGVDPYYSFNWEQRHQAFGNDVEDSSLESNPVTYSDYGSLPRKTHKRHRTPTCSPSAFLKQLTSMRKQIIETSREELLNGPNHH